MVTDPATIGGYSVLTDSVQVRGIARISNKTLKGDADYGRGRRVRLAPCGAFPPSRILPHGAA